MRAIFLWAVSVAATSCGTSSPRPSTASPSENNATPTASASASPGHDVSASIAEDETSVRPLREDARAFMHQLPPSFGSCFNRMGLTEPAWKGKIAFAIRIGVKGHVLSVNPVRVEGFNDDVVTCMSRLLEKMIFDPSDAGERTVLIPVAFHH